MMVCVHCHRSVCALVLADAWMRVNTGLCQCIHIPSVGDGVCIAIGQCVLLSWPMLE